MDRCPKCGEEMYSDCVGMPRCETCDPPCPYCYDGGPLEDDDDEQATT